MRLLPSLLFLLFCSVLFVTCIRTDIEALEFVEVTNTQVEIAGWGSVRLSAQITGLREGTVQERGFLWSVSNPEPILNAADVQQVVLDPADDFDTTIYNLAIDPIVYYMRAYTKFGERTVYSEVRSFSFQSRVSIDKSSYYISNDTFIVQGAITGLENLRSTFLEDHGHVISIQRVPDATQDDTTSLNAIGTNKIFTSRFTNLSFNTAYTVRAYVRVKGRYYYSDTLQFTTKDGWLAANNAGLPPLQHAVAVATKTRGYAGIGCGGSQCDFETGVTRDFWEFLPLPNQGKGQWIKKARFQGDARVGATAFCIGDHVYVGLGGISKNNTIEYFKDFWKFYPQENGGLGRWERLTDFPGEERWDAVAFTIGNKAYVGTGAAGKPEEEVYFYDFYEFDPAGNEGMGSWSLIDSLPIRLDGMDYFQGRKGAVAFAVQEEGYVGTGEQNSLRLRDFWKFNPMSGKWTFANNFPGDARNGATGFTVEEKGYICTGINNDLEYVADCWELNPITMQWKQQTAFRGNKRWLGVSFAIDKKGYVGMGIVKVPFKNNFEDIIFKDWWIYTPAK